MKLTVITDANGVAPLAGQMMRPTPELHQVDWTREAALLLDMGEQRTAGYSITVTEVGRTTEGVALTCQVRKPGRGDFVAQVITHPYAVAWVPREWLHGATVVVTDQNGTELLRQVVSL